jgi:hypothetical protein
MVLLNLTSFETASKYLDKVQYFQHIEQKPLQSAQVNRMLGIG